MRFAIPGLPCTTWCSGFDPESSFFLLMEFIPMKIGERIMAFAMIAIVLFQTEINLFWVSRSKDGCSYTDVGRTLFNGDFKIVRHPHRKLTYWDTVSHQLFP